MCSTSRADQPAPVSRSRLDNSAGAVTEERRRRRAICSAYLVVAPDMQLPAACMFPGTRCQRRSVAISMRKQEVALVGCRDRALATAVHNAWKAKLAGSYMHSRCVQWAHRSKRKNLECDIYSTSVSCNVKFETAMCARR